MGRLGSGSFGLTTAVLCLLGSIWGCGGHKPAGSSPFASKINLSPTTSTSLQIGGTVSFTASAQNGSGSNVGVSFIYNSSDTSTLTVAPNGVACAGQWDSTYTVCTPGGVGVALVTATALGATSAPTYVFVHAPIDHIAVMGVLPPDQTLQEPCLSQGQTMTVEAKAFNQGTDITASVGPFTWSANNNSVVTLAPVITNFTYNVATNQANAVAATPGITQIYATASGVTSNSFQQPLLAQGTSPLLDFFETCPVQNITLEVGPAGSQQSGQTSFVSSKGSPAETVTAVVTDVMGNTSVVGSNTPVLLSQIPLTWSSSRPTVVTAPASCALSCSISTPLAGAASVTASCSPPTCNIGYPEVPAILSSPACAQFFASCQQFIPLPVYATTAISGVITGAATATSVLATTSSCAFIPPLDCTSALYNVATAKAVAGNENPLPFSPTSLLFDLAGDKAYMGSEESAFAINAANLGSSNNPFSGLGAVTGKVLAVSSNGNASVFSDTTLSPNEVFVTSSGGGAGVTVLNIRRASAAAFSPDGLKAFIFGFDDSGVPHVYVHSTVQALQTLPSLPPGTNVNSIAFSSNGAFVYVVEPSLGGGGPKVTVYNMCDNAVATSPFPALTPQVISLSATPISFKALPDGVHFVALEGGGTIDYISAAVTGIPAATVSAPATSICPMHVSHSLQTLNLSQGNIQPLDFFTSPDGTLMYVVAADRGSVLVHDFLTGATNGIELEGNALPVQVGISSDAGTIIIEANDAKLHEVSTAGGGADLIQTSFPNLPNYLNPFCTDAAVNCILDLIAVKP
jgi:hypothetical protein